MVSRLKTILKRIFDWLMSFLTLSCAIAFKNPFGCRWSAHLGGIRYCFWIFIHDRDTIVYLTCRLKFIIKSPYVFAPFCQSCSARVKERNKIKFQRPFRGKGDIKIAKSFWFLILLWLLSNKVSEEGDLEAPNWLSVNETFVHDFDDKYFINFLVNEYINCLSYDIQSVEIFPLILNSGGPMAGVKNCSYVRVGFC